MGQVNCSWLAPPSHAPGNSTMYVAKDCIGYLMLIVNAMFENVIWNL